MISRWAPLFAVVALFVLLAVPASAAALHDDFDDSLVRPGGTSSKEWAETFWDDLDSNTKESEEPNHAGYPGGHSAWVSWRFYEDTDAEASACGAKGADLLIAVYTGSAVNELTEVGSDSEESENGCVRIRFDAKKGTTYRIAVDAKSNPGSTSMIFNMGRYPVNDDFADAIVLPELPIRLDADPGLAGPEPGEPPRGEKPAGNSSWYRWTAGKSGLVSVNTCDYWPTLHATVFTGPALEELTQVAGPIINPGICDETRFAAEEGTTYSIRVEGSAGRYGGMSVDFEWVEKTSLSVTKSGSGDGTVVSEPAGIECGGSCEASFYRGVLDYGQIAMTLTAVPDPGSVFVGWSGEGWRGPKYPFEDEWEPGCGTEPVCEFSMFAAPTEVTAEFEALPSLVVPGPGSGSIQPPSSSPAPPAPQASAPPQRKKPKCAKRKKRGKKGAKAKSSKRRACKR